MPVAEGFFVDWDGNARNTLDPGGGYVCETDPVARYVAITTKGGTLVHEGTFYKTLTDIEKAGIKASFVPGSHPWGRPEKDSKVQRGGEEIRICFPRPFSSMRRPAVSCAETT